MFHIFNCNQFSAATPNEKSSKKVHFAYEDFLKQVKEMGVKMVILGGSSETSYSNAAILDNFTKID